MFPLSHFSHLCTYLILIHICTLKIALTQDPTSPTLVIRLFHYLSTDSPYFDPSKSTRDLAHLDLKSSISHATYLTANTSSLVYLMDIETQVTSTGSGFLAHLQVGSIFLNQLVHIDTGSSLLWINCEPCVLTVPGPIFDPKESSSFQKEKCNRPGLCDATGAVKVQCKGISGCTYDVYYGDGHYSKGYLARETFKFGRSAEILKDIVFGCSKHTSLKANGVLGLGVNSLSLLAQRHSSKFAYCIGNISDKSYPYNTLVIGDQIDFLGYKTPLIVEAKYYITLEGIKIGDKALEIDPRIFRRNSVDYTGGMMVDTGSTYTYIPRVALEKFEAEIISLIGSLVPRNYSITYEGYTRLCYNGVLTRDLTGFPILQLQFQGDAILELVVENIFYQYYDENFCLAILPSEVLKTTVSILGNVMQQNFYIAYDLKGMQLAFQRIDCDVIAYHTHGELKNIP